MLDFNGKTRGILILTQDVTAKKRAEEEILKINEKFQNIFDSSPSGIITVDVEGKITSWSPKCVEIFGWKAEDVIGKFNPTVPKNMKDFYINSIFVKIT